MKEIIQNEKSNLSPAFSLAMNSDMDLEKLERLLEIQRQWEKDQAIKSFNVAFAKFQSEMPTLIKDAHVSFKTSKGVTDYRHATLGGVLDQLREPLSKNGLSIQWEIREIDGGMLSVTAILRHIDGHCTTTTMTSPSDQTGGKNAIQAKGSTITYLSRYTLFAIIGAGAEDDDGLNSEIPITVERIDEEHADKIKKILITKGLTEKTAVKLMRKKRLNIESIDEIPVGNYEAVLAWAKRQADAE
jgi:hypothetical protein